MKNVVNIQIILFSFFAVSLLFSGCKTEENPEMPVVKVSGIPAGGFSFAYFEGFDEEFSVESDTPWEINKSDVWAVFTPAAGTYGTTTVKLRTLKNAGDARSVEFTITATGGTASKPVTWSSGAYTVSQDAYLEAGISLTGLTEDEVTFEAEDPGTFSFELLASYPWNITMSGDNASWVNVSPVNGEGAQKATITLKPQANTKLEPRECTLTVYTADPLNPKNAKTKKIALLQKAVLPYLDLSSTEPVVFNADGQLTSGTDTYIVSTNLPLWNVSSNQPWLTVTETATGFTLSAATNSFFERAATVTVTAGTLTITLQVTQGGATLNNVAFKKPCVASDTYSATYPASGATDGEKTLLTGRWVTPTGAFNEHWVEIDLQGSYYISGIGLWREFNATHQMQKWSFQVWKDNAWVSVISEDNCPQSNYPIYFGQFNSVITNKVRWYVPAYENNQVRLFELEVYGFKVENVALLKPATASDIYSATYPASGAVDGKWAVNNDRWVSLNTADEHWVEVDLLGSYTIVGMRLRRQEHATQHMPKWMFQAWIGNAWVTVLSEDNYPTTISLDYFNTFNPTMTGKVRWYVPPYTDNMVRLYELEVYAIIQ